MITRRTLARTGALGLAGAIAAPRIARGETRRWRMVHIVAQANQDCLPCLSNHFGPGPRM
jgi:hypothetical protein